MTKNELRNWILRQLGAPLLNIELDNSQIDDKIEEAMTLFNRQHYDGSDQVYILFPVTISTTKYDMPSTVVDILEVYNGDHGWYTSDDPLLLKPFLVGNEVYENLYGQYSIADAQFFRQRLDNIDKFYRYDVVFEFNSTTKKLNLHSNPKGTATYAARAYVSESDQTVYYTNDWFRNYCCALCEIQWGNNLSKYAGSALPGGVTLNYDKILNAGLANRDRLIIDLETKYSKTVDFFAA